MQAVNRSRTIEKLCATRLAWILMIGTAFVVGCGEDRGLVPVRGRVTFDGGAPPKPGRLSFGPVKAAEGFSQRPGLAIFDANGAFEVTSYAPGDGLTPGTYRVNVLCVEREPAPVPGGLEAVTYVAPGYKGQEVVVAFGSKPIELEIDVPLKKRK
jgi:hypothetical protein